MKDEQSVKEGQRLTAVINITTIASKDGLKELLLAEAAKQGIVLRHLCGQILEESLKYKVEYDRPLENPLPNTGLAINIVVSPEAKEELKAWAKEKKRRLGRHSTFLLEKWLELNPSKKH